MAVVIPTSDVASTNFNGQIAALTTYIANSAGNGILISKLQQDKRNIQFQLVQHLIGNGNLSCASILANETYMGTSVSDGR